jgi:K+-sensing histidine kinase KdpD
MDSSHIRQHVDAMPGHASEARPRSTQSPPVIWRTFLGDIIRRRHAESALNKRLYHQSALAELGKRALAGTSVSELIAEALACIAQSLQAEYCGVWELLPDGKVLLLRAGVGWKEGYVGKATMGASSDPEAGETFGCENPVIVDDLRGDARAALPPLRDHEVSSGMSVVIRGQGRPFGILDVYTRRRRTFTADDSYFLGDVANVLALAIPRRQAEAAQRRYAERLEVLQEIDRAILAAQSLTDIVRAAMSRIRRLVPCQRASVVLFDFDKAEASFMAIDGNWELGPGECTIMPLQAFSPLATLKQGPVRYVEDIASCTHRPPLWDRLLAGGIRSFITAPLFTGDDLFGEFNLAATRPAAFDAEHQAIAREVAHSLAVAIRQANLCEQATQAQVLRRADETYKALLNSVSHNLSTPLAIIKAGAGSLLQEDVEWDPMARRDFAASIDHEVDRLNRLVSNLLDMSRIEAGALRSEKELYPIREVTQAVAARLAKLSAHHRLVLDVQDDLPLVSLDYVQIDQVLSNLVENAIKHTPRGTEIRIWAHAVAEELQVGVSDRGLGIPIGDRNRVFEKFFRRTHSKANGSGLGLTVSKGLLEAHGGRIWIEDTPGGGTTVVFTLPLARRPLLLHAPPADGECP